MSLPRIAVDAMGGDEGVRNMVAGVALAHQRDSRIRFLLVGDEAKLSHALSRHAGLSAACAILHADDVISGEEKPSQAIRRARSSSMGLAINAV